MSDYLMHFNPHHDPKNGQFASGGTHGKIRNLIVSNELGKIDQRQRAALKGAAAGKKIREKVKTEKYIKREMRGITRRKNRALGDAYVQKKVRDVFSNEIGKRKNQRDFDARKKEIYANAKKEYDKVKNYKMSDIKKERMYAAKQWVKDLAFRNAISFFTGKPTYSHYNVGRVKSEYRLYN